VGVMRQQLARDVQAVEVGHAYIKDHNIGLQLFGHFDRFTAIGCLAANLPSLMFLQKGTQTSTHDFVIVG